MPEGLGPLGPQNGGVPNWCDNPPMSWGIDKGLNARRLGVLLAACLTAGGCGNPTVTTTPAATSAPPSPSPSPASTASASPVPSSDIASALATIEADVQAIRQLSLKGPVDPTFVNKAQLQTVINDSFNQDNPPDQIALNEKLLKGLGLLPPDASLKELYLKLLGSQVLGLYQPKTKHFYVLTSGGGLSPLARFTFSHEFDHALQDQNFGLAKLGVDQIGQGDGSLAHLSVAEGDATLVMGLWARENLTLPELLGLAQSADPQGQQVLLQMPRILRDTLTFPYTSGLNFVTGLQTTGGWSAVNALYRTPPESTEQVLHPAKYDAHEKPVAVSVPADLARRLGAGWKVSFQDTLGEFQLGIWLADASGGRVDSEEATTAAAGWGGDRAALLEGPNGSWSVVLLTAWDSAAEAGQFETAAIGTVQGLTHPAAVLPGVGAVNRTVIVGSDSAVLSRTANALGSAG